MKITRAAFFAVLAAALVTGGSALAERGGNGGGNGGGRSKKKTVINGTVTAVSEDGTFVLHRNGGRGNRRAGADVTIVTNVDTVFLRSDEAAFSPEDLAIGVKAQAKGKLNADGSLTAVRVLIKVADETEE